MSIFPTTRWSIFSHRTDEADRKEIWDYMARVYWSPLQLVAVGKQLSPEDADDAVQQFFKHLLEENFIDKPDREFGKLRSFLRWKFDRFLLDQRRKSASQKRGGSAQHVDHEDVELSARDYERPDEAYDRQCALQMFEEAVRRTQSYYRTRPHHFETLLAVAEGNTSAADAWKKLDCTPGNGRVALSRFRSRLEQNLKAIIRESCDPQFPEILEEELRLVKRLRGNREERGSE